MASNKFSWRTDLLRPFLWALVAGVAVAVIQVLAGVRKPLALLLPALGASIVVAIIVELWPRLELSRRLHSALSALAARSPIEVRIQRRPAPVVREGERGLWDFRRDGERAMNAMNDILTEMAREIAKAGKRLQRHTRRMSRATARGVNMERGYELAEQAAKEIERHAARMERSEVRYREQTGTMIRNFADWLQSDPDNAQVREWLMLLQGMADAAAEGRQGIEGYRESVRDLRNQNVSRPLNRATDRLIAVLTKVIEDVAATETFGRDPLHQV